MKTLAHPRALLLTLLLCCLLGQPAWALTLAQQGQTDAVIVVAEQATPAEKHAADELAHFLHQITGADFAIASQAPADTLCLLVGPDAARQAEPGFPTDTLGPDAIRIKTLPNALILAGPRPRGSLYAVYCFLERIGCRWWTSTAAAIPQKNTLEVDDLDVTYVPPLEYRSAFWYDTFRTDFAARNRCNGHSEHLDEAHGGKHTYAGFVHTFYALIPPSKYFDDHPEWFSMIEGQRKHERAQLCQTNDAMRAELTKNLRVLLRNYPQATIASVSQNDWHGCCTCPACAALDEKEGSHAGSLLHFVNTVAADIEQEFPYVAISTLAYQYTRKPPKHVKPRPNVIIRLCTIECSFSRPLDHPQNAAFANDIRGWAPLTDRLYIWDYTTNFSGYQLPHPNLRVLGPNIKFFVANHVKGIMEQGCYNTDGGELAELRGWVLAQLLWDPSRDANALIDEFLTGYYGPAGPHIRKYIDIVHDAVENTGYFLRCFTPPTADYLTYDTLARGYAHLVAAEQAVQTNPDLLDRVQAAQMPVLCTFLARWNDFQAAAQTSDIPWPLDPTPQTVFETFKTRTEKNNVSRITEWKPGLGPLIDLMPSNTDSAPPPAADTAAAETSVRTNVLTEQEKAEGFKLLFNGQDLTGWKRHDNLPGHGLAGKWTVEEAAIVGVQDPPGKGGFLTTLETFENFDLRLETQIDWPFDSGVFLRVGPAGKSHQVTLDYRPDGSIGNIYCPWVSGTVYESPNDGMKLFKKGQWNNLHIICQGEPAHIRVWLNDALITDFQHTQETTKGVPERGTIALQIHPGGEGFDQAAARFRTIRVRELATDQVGQTTP